MFGWGATHGIWFWVGIAVWAAFAALILFVVIRLALRVVGSSNGSNKSESGESHALDILNERYARGELDREQYLDMKRLIDR
jgi:putative membrane protein